MIARDMIGTIMAFAAFSGALPCRPCRPAESSWPWLASWRAQHSAMLEDRGTPRIVFLGDSLTAQWAGTGTTTWASRFQPLGAENYGLSGDSTRQILYRVRDGLLDGLGPRLHTVVLMIGTNNLYANRDGGTDEDVARGILRCVHLIEARAPGVRVVLLGILPRAEGDKAARALRINRMTGAVELADVFAPGGKLDGRLYQDDGVHLSAAGYRVLGREVAALLKGRGP